MNIAKMMQQANKMQSDMKSMQERLKQVEIENTVAGVTVKISGDGEEIKAISIDATLVDPNDKETLEDSVTAAVNQAIKKAKEAAEGEAKKIMGGLQLPPGMKLPF